MILAPDDRLPQGPARWSREALAEAWSSCRRELKAALLDPAVQTVAILVGVPGAGKSAWTRDHDQPGLVVFDACWTDPGRRAAVARQIRAAGKVAIAVWIQTPLDVCRERNAARPPDRRVPDAALARAWVALRHHPPTVAEGWSRVLVQDGQAVRVHDAAVPPERQLERLARAPANQTMALVRSRLLPAYRAAQQQAAQDPDRPPPRVVQSLRGIARALERGQAGDDQVGRGLGRIGARIEAGPRRAWQTLVREHLEDYKAEPQADLVSDWAERVGEQIADVRARVGPGLTQHVAEAWRKGWSAADLERSLVEYGIPLDGGGTAEGQGSVLASDAYGGLLQAATEAHQADLGADWYEWEHNPSKSPRPEHVARHGKRYRWSKPPSDGHPGTLRNCHCTAKPVLLPEDIERLKEPVAASKPRKPLTPEEKAKRAAERKRKAEERKAEEAAFALAMGAKSKILGGENYTRAEMAAALRDFAGSDADAKALVLALSETSHTPRAWDPTSKPKTPDVDAYKGSDEYSRDAVRAIQDFARTRVFGPPVHRVVEETLNDEADAWAMRAGLVKDGQWGADLGMRPSLLDSMASGVRDDAETGWRATHKHPAVHEALSFGDTYGAANVAMRQVMVHEYGHSVQSSLARSRLGRAIEQRYQELYGKSSREERGSVSEYALTNSEEFFAETYTLAVSGQWDQIPDRFRGLFRVITAESDP